jgi:hypothetical protein
VALVTGAVVTLFDTIQRQTTHVDVELLLPVDGGHCDRKIS